MRDTKYLLLIDKYKIKTILNKFNNWINSYNRNKIYILDDTSDTTVILTVWKRSHLEEQLYALSKQTQKSCQVWVYQCGNYIDVKPILKNYPGVLLIHSEVNLKYYGRFSLAQYVNSKFVWVLDDDVIPSANWLEMSEKICIEQNAIVASAGRVIPKGDYFPEQSRNVDSFFFGDVSNQHPWNFCKEETIVDFGCNSWFFQRSWIQHFWSIPPYTLDTAEDMHLSAILKLKFGIRTIVPKQVDVKSTGNLKIKYGRDRDASWIKPDFLRQREQVLKYLIDDQGWQPQLWSKNNYV